ncbi:MAG TPA: WD40 repeat domain-containing protein, partial [Candidatus Dormibacteraeota bacterium]|nr:WD40 repeat domain-containing protein [Candidatus Dormibacteraeota bacterium]
DGQMLVTCAADAFFTHCPARLWDRKTGKLLFELLHQDGVLSAAFTPDGRRVVTASEDFTAIIWDTRTGKQLAPPLRHGEKVMNVRVSQDGKWALTSSMDCTARLWDLESGAPAAPAFCHSAAVFDSQFVAGGRQVLTRDNHGNQYLWNLTFEGRPPGEMEKAALVLSGGTVVGAGSPSANNLPLGQLSGELPALFPHRPSQAERTIWHEMAVLESESQENWNAELFNLKQLQALGSDDPTIPQKIIQVSHKLAEVRAH